MSSWNQFEADDEVVSPKRRRIDSASAVKMTGFINYGPKKVQGGDQLTLHVYCIDPHDSAFNNVVPHVEKDKDYTLWGHPKCCNVPGGEHIDISVQQTSDILTIDDDEKDKQFDANWSGFTSVEFQFHVGEPEESCKAKVFLNVSCGGSHLTDIKMTSNVNPACERGVLSTSGNEPSAENAPETPGRANGPDSAPVEETDYGAGNQTKKDTTPSKKELKRASKLVKDHHKLAEKLGVSENILKQRSPNKALTVLIHWLNNSDTPTKEHLLRCLEEILGTGNKDLAKLRAEFQESRKSILKCSK